MHIESPIIALSTKTTHIIHERGMMMENIKGRFFKELNTYYVFPEDGKMAILYQDGSHTLLAVGDNLSYGGKFTQEMLKEGLSRCIGTAEFALDHLTWRWKMTKEA